MLSYKGSPGRDSALSEDNLARGYPFSEWSETSTEQEFFDAQATSQITELVQRLEETIYVENCDEESVATRRMAVFDECKEWSLLFPHLRIRGKSFLNSTESGIETFSTNGFIPAFESCEVEAPSQKPGSLAIQGEALDNAKASNTSLPVANGCMDETPRKSSLKFTAKASDAINSLKAAVSKKAKAFWALFAFFPASEGESTSRSVTPTADDPHGRRVQHEDEDGNRPVIDVCETGVGDFASMRKLLHNIMPSSPCSGVFILCSDGPKAEDSSVPQIAYVPVAPRPESLDDSAEYVDVSVYDIYWELQSTDAYLCEFPMITLAEEDWNLDSSFVPVQVLALGSFAPQNSQNIDLIALNGYAEEWLAVDES
ncbi:hypothetical protein HDU96_001708 [Phlyctochytrium bullatum]|nr:hypothetical protein HDU96_001708 [Phlyctochytrium bullatum]